MKVAVFGAKSYDRQFLSTANEAAGAEAGSRHEFTFIRATLDPATAPLAGGHEATCIFVNDRADAEVLEILAGGGVRLLALRSAGFNHVDLEACARLGLTVARVPAYSPYAVAEHAVALLLALNRRIPRAASRVREGNFELSGLLGFDLHGRTAGVIGTGQIGAVAARILLGFGMRVLAYDVFQNKDLCAAGICYVPLDQLLKESDVVTLHIPLMKETHHLINDRALGLMKPGAMLINTSRGPLLDTRAAIRALKSSHLGGLALDVYEGEAELFFKDRSGEVLEDDTFARLLTFPNVLITAHQAFFTQDALEAIARTTLQNLSGFEHGGIPQANLVALPQTQGTAGGAG